MFRTKTSKTEDGQKNYVLTFVSANRILNCIIYMKDGMFWINKSIKYPSFPALVDGYMNKKRGDYYLLTGLNNLNPNICDDDKILLSNISLRNQPRSLPCYHGKLNNKVIYLSFYQNLHYAELFMNVSHCVSNFRKRRSC